VYVNPRIEVLGKVLNDTGRKTFSIWEQTGRVKIDEVNFHSEI
jgi:hypothetical protein